MSKAVALANPVAWSSVYRKALSGSSGAQWPSASFDMSYWRGLLLSIGNVNGSGPPLFSPAMLTYNGAQLSLDPSAWDPFFGSFPPTIWLPNTGPIATLSLQLATSGTLGTALGGSITAYFCDQDFGPAPLCVPQANAIALVNVSTTVAPSGTTNLPFWWVGPFRVMCNSGGATNMTCELRHFVNDPVAGVAQYVVSTLAIISNTQPVILEGYAFGATQLTLINGEAASRVVGARVVPNPAGLSPAPSAAHLA